MAAAEGEPLSQAAVLGFLRAQGGQVRHSALVSRFKPLLDLPGGGGGGGGEPEEARAALRERFKRFVNAVAVVKEWDGVKWVVLKKKHLLAAPGPRGWGHPGQVQEAEEEEEEKEEEEEEEEEEEGEREGSAGSPLTPACPGGPGTSARLPWSETGAPEEEEEEEEGPAVPVARLKSFFQRREGEVPQPPGGKDPPAPRGPPQKPCMLPVRCVPASSPVREPEAPTPEREPPEAKDWLRVGASAAVTPSASPYARRRPFDEMGSSSPYLRRVPKSQKVGEDAADGAVPVPLEAAEHEWLVKATAGQWSQQLHGLLLRDKTLASKRDFMTGFTVLHWAAKSGNCEMLRKVIEVVEKGGADINVNAKSHGGYTPLHIAAIHGQEEVIARLVRDYNAKVNLRDYSGKKPFQYLKEGSSFAVRHLLRDPGLHALTGQHNASLKKNAKVAASILSSTSTVLGLLSDDTTFYELTKGLKKPASLNRFLSAATAPRRKLRSRSTFSSYSSLSESLEEEQEEATTKRRPVSELFFGH